MEKNSSISLAFSFLTVLMQALLQQCRSKSKRCIQIPGLERNTKRYPGSSRKEIAKIHLCVTDAGWLPSKQAKTIHTAVTKASHTHKHKQKQTDVNTHTHMHQNKHTKGKRRREEDGAEWWKWRWWEMTACLVLDLEGKPGEKRDESSFSETSWKPKDVHTLG